MAYNRPKSSYGDNKKKFKRTYHRRKICKFCADSNLVIDYKDYKTLRYFTTERGKITPCRISGNCAKHQRIPWNRPEMYFLASGGFATPEIP